VILRLTVSCYRQLGIHRSSATNFLACFLHSAVLE
jgi:hypothetical protein